MVNSSISSRVQKHRDSLREKGLRPVQLWVPDTRLPGFGKECRRQSRLAAKSDESDAELLEMLNDALADLDGWTA